MRRCHPFNMPPARTKPISAVATQLLAFLVLIGVGLTHLIRSAPARGRVQSNQQPIMDRRIPVRGGLTLRIENPSGSIHVQTWSQPEVHLRAIWPNAGMSDSWYSFRSTKDPSPVASLKIEPIMNAGIDVSLTVPVGVYLRLRTVDEAIVVTGPVAGLTAESGAGDIIVRLPQTMNADVALHSTSGNIRSELPTVLFGGFDSHNLQAKLGRGGSTFLLRSMTGDVSLLPLVVSSKIASGQIATVDQGPSSGQTLPPAQLASRANSELSASGVSASVADSSRPDDLGEPVRLEAPLVNLNASVRDRSGQPIVNLSRSDFRVYEDGVEQRISHFSPTTTPFDLALLLDLSGSTREKIEVIKRAAIRFVDMIGPEDRLAVFTFRRDVRLIARLTHDRQLLKRRIRSIRRGSGGTAFYNALWFATDEMQQSPSPRKAIVVMTDGVDNLISSQNIFQRMRIPRQDFPYNGHSFEALSERLEESEVIVYPIYLDTEYDVVIRRRQGKAEHYAIARRQLAELAERTAGTLFKADRVEDLEGVYQQVADELRTVYSLAYEPTHASADGTWRRIRLKVNRPHAAVRSKRGYYAR